MYICIHLYVHLYTQSICSFVSKTNGTLFLAMDANFGLVHKANSGTSIKGPVLVDQVFYSQPSVDEYLQKYSAECKTAEQVG